MQLKHPVEDPVFIFGRNSKVYVKLPSEFVNSWFLYQTENEMWFTYTNDILMILSRYLHSNNCDLEIDDMGVTHYVC